MFGNTFRMLSLARIIGGARRTLNIANELIPLYKEAKPMYDNVKKTISMIKDFGNTANTRINNNVIKNINPIKEKISTISTNHEINRPTFFQ